ncbi:MAG: preprotein translocase subunit YajC [Myxococcaceae bacterium]
MSSLVFLVAIFAIMYFVMIRPQQKQLKAHRELLAGLKKGDEVVTQGGLIGRIFVVMDREVTLEVANGVKLRVLKSAVQGRVTENVLAARGEEKEEK